MCIDKFTDINNEYNNTYHKAKKVKPADVKSSTYYGFCVENSEKYPKFEPGEM